MENKLNKPFTVVVEGNIGSGKTTFLNYSQKLHDVCVLSEPIELWRNCNGHNLFAYMHNDPKKWSFSFQSYIQFTMLQNHTLKTPHPIKLMERSVYSARYCFVEKMLQDGILPSASASVIDEWFKWIIESFNITPDLIVYLRTSPEIVYERMVNRNRSEEKLITLEYLQDLHEIHENWLLHKTLQKCPAPVLTINANLNRKEITREYEKVFNYIK